MSQEGVIPVADLRQFPFYARGQPPDFLRYHAEVDYMDELERIWGKRWGAQGIGRLREVAMVRPTAVETSKDYDQDKEFWMFAGELPDLAKMQAQHDGLAATYRRLGIQVHYMEYPEQPRSAYGPMRRTISAAAGFVVNGGAIIPREATPYWRGRSRYVAQFLMAMGCPILYTVHGKGVCEIGAFTRMADDFIIGFLSTDANAEGIRQVKPILHQAGYQEVWIGHSPGVYQHWYPEQVAWMHADMWVAPLDIDLALIHPPLVDFNTLRRLHELGYTLLEVHPAEAALYPTNLITIAPRQVVMIDGCPRTAELLARHGVEVTTVPYDEVLKYGGGIRCTTMQLVRDPGPRLFGEGKR